MGLIPYEMRGMGTMHHVQDNEHGGNETEEAATFRISKVLLAPDLDKTKDLTRFMWIE